MSEMDSDDLAAARVGPGTQLRGSYEIDRRIGSGGMGEIFRGHAVESGDRGDRIVPGDMAVERSGSIGAPS